MTAADRTKPLLAAAVALLMLGGALWLQAQGQTPCPLCILQRLAALGVLVGAGLAAGLGRRGFSWIGLLAALAGLALAIKHLWLVLHPGWTCGLDPLAAVINGWRVTAALPWLLRADGLCSEVPWLLHLPLPGWSALGFACSAALLLVAALRRR